jgi:putative transposase
MHNAAITGLPGPGRASRNSGVPTDDDLVNRRFNRDGLNELWVSDITEHKTREGKIYCCAVLDTCRRKIVGWSIDSVQDSQLVVKALDMAIKQRKPRPGGVVHADRLNLVNSHPGLSRATCVITDSNSAWERLVIAMTMP